MKAGAAEVDITPPPGIELSGFLAREQPSVSVLDPLYAKALYVEDGEQKLLWLHADVLGFDGAFVEQFRLRTADRLGLHPDHILLSATHTHSGPAVAELINCGKPNAEYVEELQLRMQHAAKCAIKHAEPVELVVSSATLELGIDRRKKRSAHTDPRISAVGFRRPDGSYAAAVLNYAMHPVALGSSNRAISADWCGYAAAWAANALPGSPVVLMTNGAAGNINPPGENVSPAQVREWGEAVAKAIVPQLANAKPCEPRFASRFQVFPMPLEIWSEEAIDRSAETQLNLAARPDGWNDRYVDAVRRWQQNRKAEIALQVDSAVPLEIHAIRFGPLVFVTAGGEFFSRYADLIRAECGQDVRVIGYANRNFGYVAPYAAYDEGGYEVDSAHFFYNTFRARPGSLEQLARDACILVRHI